MFAPERVGRWYIGGGLGGFKEESNFFVSRHVSVGIEYRKFKLHADLEPTIPGKIDAGGDFLFATVRGHF
jgi:hypothetical protein